MLGIGDKITTSLKYLSPICLVVALNFAMDSSYLKFYNANYIFGVYFDIFGEFWICSTNLYVRFSFMIICSVCSNLC